MDRLKIDMKMTERDKKIIKYFGMFLIVFVFGYLVIKPSFEAAVDYRDQKDELQIQLDDMQSLIDQRSLIESQVASYQKIFNQKASGFYEMMKNQEIDNLITGLFSSYGLEARDLSISASSEMASLNYYVYSDEAKKSQAKNENSDESSSSTEKTNTYSKVYVSNVTVRATGDRTRFIQLIDDIYNEKPGMLIKNYSLTSESNSQTTTTSLSLGIDIYMVSKE